MLVFLFACVITPVKSIMAIPSCVFADIELIFFVICIGVVLFSLLKNKLYIPIIIDAKTNAVNINSLLLLFSFWILFFLFELFSSWLLFSLFSFSSSYDILSPLHFLLLFFHYLYYLYYQY